MEEKKLVPKRRFIGFREEWKTYNLGEKVEFFSGLTYSPNDVVLNNGTLVIRSSNIKNNQIIDADNVFVDKNIVNSEQVRVGDIIVVVRNGSRDLIGKNAVVRKESPDTVIGAFMTGIRSKYYNFNYTLLNTKLFNKQVAENLGATINQITTGMFNKMVFNFPAIEEQQKIGEFFKVLDERIANQERKIAKVKALKSAYLTEMFPQEGEIVPKRRFKGFTEEWKYRKLSDLTELYVGNSFSSDINNKGKYVVMDMGSVSQEGYRLKQKRTNLKRDILNKDDLVMPKDDIGGGQIIGKTAHINKNNSYVLGDHVFRLRFFDNEGLFMHYHINSKPINLSLKKKVTGSAQLGIKSINVLNQYITIPTIEEQQKIGSFFKNLDDQIATEEKKLEKLKKMKEAYLEEMFV